MYVCLIDNQNIHENSKNKYTAEAHCKNNLKVQITWSTMLVSHHMHKIDHCE